MFFISIILNPIAFLKRLLSFLLVPPNPLPLFLLPPAFPPHPQLGYLLFFKISWVILMYGKVEIPGWTIILSVGITKINDTPHGIKVL